MTGEDALVGYFGFGSLVNKHTLRTSYVDILPATLKGWRRHWQARTDTLQEEIALLSIHRDETSEIKGMLVLDRVENLPAVDEREAGYRRHTLSREDLIFTENGSQIPDQLYVYVANETDKENAGFLLQSYLDAVLQGFFNEYGREGVEHFVDTTADFERPLIEDRDSPRYPRSVSLSVEEMVLFDQETTRAGVLRN